jgi:hypothetical protein
MNYLLKRIKAGSFFLSGKMFIVLFTGFLIFVQNPVIALSCEQLDSIAPLRIENRICDSLKKKQDNDFIKVQIYIFGLDEPQPLPKGTDSITMKRWLDSVYNPWSAENVIVLAHRADSLVKTFDLRNLNDTSQRLYSVPDGRLGCQIKVHELSALIHFPYLAGVEPYLTHNPLGILPKNVSPSTRKIAMEQEYFTLNGKKIISGAKSQGTRSLGIVITREILSNGRIITRKVID